MSNNLIPKPISQLLGENFFVPHYQRGYRWTEQQVKDLLDDVDSFVPRQIDQSDEKTFYCLQPVVVKECSLNIKQSNGLEGKWYEVVDGQQRLTTIYLIIHYANEMWVGKQKNPEFGIRYETRERSADFLRHMKVNDETGAVDIDKSFIDFYYMSKAYQTIHTWVETYQERNGHLFDNNDFQSKFKTHTKVIWYEVNEDVDSIELFTRLNMGKIPLTNAELIKALFLNSSSFQNESKEEAIRRKIEISQFWDEMEQRLNDEHFWAFVTNRKQNDFANKIELLFDLIAKKQKQIDPLHTFLYFLRRSKDPSTTLWDLWLTIEQFYFTLSQWYQEKNLYHKVGYLITTGKDLGQLIELSLKTKKDVFESELDKWIAESVNCNMEELSFASKSDYRKIEKILLLFNVESIRSNESIIEFYPFRLHKNMQWSIEHIHAQNSERFDKTKREQWISWLNYHQELIEELLVGRGNEEKRAHWEDLHFQIRQHTNEKLTWDRFNTLFQEIVESFSLNTDDEMYDVHSITNLALLSLPDNAVLNNAVFEVKRRKIIQMDKDGRYIPVCTRRVFLKYYNDKPSTQQHYFWTKEDRDNYIKAIKKTLKGYLPQTTAC